MTLAYTFEPDPQRIHASTADPLAGLRPTEEKIREIHNRTPEEITRSGEGSFTLRCVVQVARQIPRADGDTTASESLRPTIISDEQGDTLKPQVRAKGHLALVVNNP